MTTPGQIIDTSSPTVFEVVTAGPQGPPGVNGVDGSDGANGADGSDASFPDGLAQEVSLQAVLEALTGTLTAAVSGSVALDAGTLAALEQLTVTVANTVTLDSGTLAALEQIQAAVSGSVALTQPTIDALNAASHTVTGTVALDAASLAALEQITVTGTVALDAGTLAALEQITVSGTVGVDPASLASLAKDSTLQDILAAVVTQAASVAASAATQASIEGLASFMGRLLTMQDPATRLPYAKTSTDAMHVVVDSSATVNAQFLVQALWNNNNYANWWVGSGSPNSMDAREQQKILSEQNAVQVRTSRWQVT